jgi:hypothetical protein
MAHNDPTTPRNSQLGEGVGKGMVDGSLAGEAEEMIEFLCFPPGRYPLSRTITLPADLHALAEMIPGTKVCRMSLVEYLRLLTRWHVLAPRLPSSKRRRPWRRLTVSQRRAKERKCAVASGLV